MQITINVPDEWDITGAADVINELSHQHFCLMFEPVANKFLGSSMRTHWRRSGLCINNHQGGKMDRGTVDQELKHTTVNIQICRYDLGDDEKALFITACDTGLNDADSPQDINQIGRAWPECVSIDELDALISALQAQRDWLQGDRYRRNTDGSVTPIAATVRAGRADRRSGAPRRAQELRMYTYDPDDLENAN